MATLKLPSISFPKENVPPKEKNSAAWLGQFASAALYTYVNLPTDAIGYRSRTRYKEIKDYANGRQSVDRYKKMTAVDKNPSNNKLVVDWQVTPVIPNYRRIALGLMEKNWESYDLSIDPIDALAAEELDTELNKIKVKLQMKDMMVKMGMGDLANNAVLEPESPNEPEDLDGLTVYEISARHRTSMELEQLVELILNGCNYTSVRRMKDEDLFDYGVAVLKDYTKNDHVGVRRVDPSRLVMSYCIYPDFSDLKYIGELHVKRLTEIEVESQGQITAEQLSTLQDMSDLNRIYTQYVLPALPSHATERDWYIKGEAYVLDLEIRTTDEVTKEISIDKNGNVRYGNATTDSEKIKKKLKQGVKFETRKREEWYKCKWVVGTDIVYDFGRVEYQKRDKNNEAKCFGSFHVYGCANFEMRVQSRVEQLIPYADEIFLARMQLQHRLNRVIPRGYKINLAALDNVILEYGGKDMKKSDLIDMMFTHGILPTYEIREVGQPEPINVIQEIGGGVANEIQEYWMLYNNAISQIRTTLGLNEVTDSSTPNPKMLKTVAQMAQIGTLNAMNDMFYADKYLTKEAVKGIIIRAQDLIQAGKYEDFISGLGKGTISILKNIKDIHKYLYTVTIDEKPSEDDMNRFNEVIKISLGQGDLTAADIVRIDNIKNQKQKELYYSYCVKKNQKQKSEEALKQQQQTGQIQIQSAQAAEQAKQQTMQAEYQLKMQYEAEKTKLLIELEKVKGEFMLERERLAASGRVEASYVQAKGRDENNIRDNKTKLIKEDKGEDTTQIDIPGNLESRVAPLTSEEAPAPPLPKFSFIPEYLRAGAGEQMPAQGMPAKGTLEEEAMETPQQETAEGETTEQEAQEQAMMGGQEMPEEMETPQAEAGEAPEEQTEEEEQGTEK